MSVNWIHNIPFFSIFGIMLTGILTALINDGRKAKKLHLTVIAIIFVMSLILLGSVVKNNESFTFMMGHFPAPWGNELKAGPIEALMACAFSVVMFCTVLAGQEEIHSDIVAEKQKFFFIMLNLLFGSMLALIYTNDLFTAYVFIEINAIASCSIVMAKSNGRALSAAMLYLVMGSLGSGLFLFGISTLYDITGHLLIPNIYEQVQLLVAQQQYIIPLTLSAGMCIVGVGIKSAMFPFHSWLLTAHPVAVSPASAILSGLVLKGYVFLIVKMIFSVFGYNVIDQLGITHVLFFVGLVGMIYGSICALKEVKLKNMLACSSVAQVSYLFMGLGMGIEAGCMATIFHIMAHAVSKAALFCSAGGLIDASEHHKSIKELQGSARRNPIAGLTFTISALSIVGVPLFAGFVSKFYFAWSAFNTESAITLFVVLIILGLSMILNAMYFIPMLINIWTKKAEKEEVMPVKLSYKLACAGFIFCNFLLGIGFGPIINIIEQGMKFF